MNKLDSLLNQHKQISFPKEVYSLDNSLVLLDADISGLISTYLHQNNTLETEKLELLKKLLVDLSKKINDLPQKSHLYFLPLIEMGMLITSEKVNSTMTPSQKIAFMITEFLNGNYQILDFCREYVYIYNFELVDESVSEKEMNIYRSLFNTTAYYNQFPEERDKWPGFKNEEEVKTAIQAAACSLHIDN